MKRTCGRLVRFLRSELGHMAGFSIPFQSATSSITKIEYTTGELLLWEAMIDPLLTHRSVVILDQVHIRSLWMDALLGVLQKILPFRKDLKIVISLPSAAIEVSTQLATYFEGITFSTLDFGITDAKVPVETYYLSSPCTNYINKTLETISKVYGTVKNNEDDGGDVLVFVPTKSDVEQVISRASNELQAKNAVFLPFYSAASIQQFQNIMSNDYVGEGIWRIIVATHVADEDYDLFAKGRIAFVIDAGFIEITETVLETRLRKQSLLPISVVRAETRRLMASNGDRVGKCYRLYTENYALQKLEKTDFPETFYKDLTEFTLRILSLGVPSIEMDFPFFGPRPARERLAHAVEKLFYLRAVNSKFKITEQGRRMADSHLPVMLARAVDSAYDYSCAQEMLAIAAMVLAGGIDSVFFDPSGKDERKQSKLEHEKFMVREGDFLTLLNVFDEFKHHSTAKWCKERYLNYRTLLRAQGIFTELCDYLEAQEIYKLSNETGRSKKLIEDRLCHCICQGFFLNAAKRTSPPDGAAEGVYYQLLNESIADDEGASVVPLHFTGVQDLSEEWVVYNELVEVAGPISSVRWHLRGVTGVKSAWLLDTGFYNETRQ